MEYKLEEISPVKRKVNITVPTDEIHAAIGATIALYRRGAEIKGFRKGKVPSSVIESRYKKQIYAEATQDLVNLHINQIMGELDLMPVSGIDFEGEEVEKGKEYAYALNFEVMPTFDIPDFEGVEVDEEIAEVKEEEVQAVFTRMQEQLAELEDVEEKRAPDDGDVAIITFSAYKDGVPIQDYRAENFQITLGEGQALPEFEAIIKALKVDESGSGEVTFPDDFFNKELAGQTLTMQVKLTGLKTKALPEVNDELAQKAGGFESVDALREAINKSYMDSRTQLNRSVAQKSVLDTLLSDVEFDLPDAMVKNHVDRMISETRGRLEQQGKGIESLGKTEEELAEEFRPEAESLTRSQIFLLAVSRQEKLEISEEEIDFYFKQAAARSGEDYRDLKNFHLKNDLMHGVKDRLLADKAMELIYSKAAVNKVAAKEETAEENEEA